MKTATPMKQDGNNFINTHETEKTEATVKKVWNDSNNQDGTRPVELTVNLMNGNGEEVNSQTLKEGETGTTTVGIWKRRQMEKISPPPGRAKLTRRLQTDDTRKNGTVTTLSTATPRPDHHWNKDLERRE